MSNDHDDEMLVSGLFPDSTDTRDHRVVTQRLGGCHVSDIARGERIQVSEVHRIIARWAETVLTSDVRRSHLALELGRLDLLQSVFFQQALSGDVPSGQLVEKIIARRSVMLGLHAPQTAVLQVIDATPKETSTERIERVLNELIEMDDRAKGVSSNSDEPATH